jgi:hypothetical protein
MAFTAIRTLRRPRNFNLLAVHDQMRKAICFYAAVVRSFDRNTVPHNHPESVIVTGIKNSRPTCTAYAASPKCDHLAIQT